MQAQQPEPASADVLERACRSTAAILEMVRSTDLDRPTPCASWNVRDVVNHIVGGTGYFAELAEKGAVTDRGDDPDCTATDFAATFRREADRLVAAYRAPGAMTRPMQMPFGELPGSVCVWIAAGDIFTHGWDLAKATGQPTDLEPDVAVRLLTQIEPILPDEMRGPDGEAAFGPRVEIADSAPAADRLAAFEGRHP
ncbi:MAG TPA: TIGR03086 family metal-binding protein [Streptosporangiaceae bacterium]